jgi:3-hydroxyacyl-CoA dehydrogenase
MSAVLSEVATSPVRVFTRSSVTVITFCNPPVNAISYPLRKALLEAVTAAQHDAACAALLLIGDGGNFMAGADLRDMGRSGLAPTLPEVCEAIESSTKPVVAAIQGACLGGGLEIALAAHVRLATGDARLGLPEVLVGLMPGAGGTQRGARLAGVAAILDLALTGRHIQANEALALGLVDEILPTVDFASATITRAIAIASAGHIPRRSNAQTTALADTAANEKTLAAARASVHKTSAGLFSPLRIIDAVEAASQGDFAAGMAVERAGFIACLDSPQRQGLQHAFFAEREVAKAPETQTAPRTIESVGVVGGGTMGAGIAVALLDAGLPVTMVERDNIALERGRSFVEKVYDSLIKRGRLEASDKAARLARLTGATDYAALAQVDLVIEAVFEDIAVKKQVFAELDRVCKPSAVLATNTSYLDIDEIAASISRPQSVIGLHFFSPANIMKLLEIVVPAKVSADVVSTGFALAKRLKKVPVRAGVCDGFIGNRILAAYRLAVDYMMEDGASPYQIDQAMKDFGFPMGPLEVYDLAGGDIAWANRKRRAANRDPQQRYVEIADRLCENGWFGQKTGRGWYLYQEGERKGRQDPAVLAIIERERSRAAAAPREFTREEIVRRALAAMVNEGARVLEERIALRPLDIDAVFLHGYGFPRHRGGPMKYADIVGLASIVESLREFAKEDAFFWQASPLLQGLAERNQTLDSLNR